MSNENIKIPYSQHYRCFPQMIGSTANQSVFMYIMDEYMYRLKKKKELRFEVGVRELSRARNISTQTAAKTLKSLEQMRLIKMENGVCSLNIERYVGLIKCFNKIKGFDQRGEFVKFLEVGDDKSLAKFGFLGNESGAKEMLNEMTGDLGELEENAITSAKSWDKKETKADNKDVVKMLHLDNKNPTQSLCEEGCSKNSTPFPTDTSVVKILHHDDFNCSNFTTPNSIGCSKKLTPMIDTSVVKILHPKYTKAQQEDMHQTNKQTEIFSNNNMVTQLANLLIEQTRNSFSNRREFYSNMGFIEDMLDGEKVDNLTAIIYGNKEINADEIGSELFVLSMVLNNPEISQITQNKEIYRCSKNSTGVWKNDYTINKYNNKEDNKEYYNNNNNIDKEYIKDIIIESLKDSSIIESIKESIENDIKKDTQYTFLSSRGKQQKSEKNEIAETATVTFGLIPAFEEKEETDINLQQERKDESQEAEGKTEKETERRIVGGVEIITLDDKEDYETAYTSQPSSEIDNSEDEDSDEQYYDEEREEEDYEEVKESTQPSSTSQQSYSLYDEDGNFRPIQLDDTVTNQQRADSIAFLQKRMQQPFFHPDEVKEFKDNILICLDRADKIFINRLYNIIEEIYGEKDIEDEDGNRITIPVETLEGIRIPVETADRNLFTPALEETLEIIRDRQYDYKGEIYEVTATISNEEEAERLKKIIYWDKKSYYSKDKGYEIGDYTLSYSAFKNMHAEKFKRSSSIMKRPRQERLKIYEHSRLQLQKIILMGEQDELFEKLTPMEKVIYYFLSDLYQISNNGEVGDRKSTNGVVTKEQFDAIMEDCKRYGVDIYDFVSYIFDKMYNPNKYQGFEIHSNTVQFLYINDWNREHSYKSVVEEMNVDDLLRQTA